LNRYIGPVLWEIGGAIRFGKDGRLKDAADWDCWQREWAVEDCLAGYAGRTIQRRGGIVLVHDIHAKSVEMIKIYVDEMLTAGFKFVTLDQVKKLTRYQTQLSPAPESRSP
jgi:hypothetical protein